MVLRIQLTKETPFYLPDKNLGRQDYACHARKVTHSWDPQVGGSYHFTLTHGNGSTQAPDKVSAQLKADKQTVDVPQDAHHVSFAALLDNDGKYKRHPVADPTDTVAVLQYTGGTTGLPKGAMLTHAKIGRAHV